MPRTGTALDLLEADERRTISALGSAVSEKRSLVSTLNDPQRWLINTITAPSKSGAAVNYLSALQVSTVYACVQILSGVISRLPICLYQRTAAGMEEILDHPALRAVTVTPDGVRTAFAWRQSMDTAALLRGNGFSRIVRNAFGDIAALTWMDPQAMEFWRTPDGDPFYRYRGEILLPYQVFHHKEMSLDGVIGLSPITCMREQVGLAISTQEHGARFFSNGAVPGVIFTAPITTTKEQMDRIRDEITKSHAGVANSNKPFVAYGGLEVKSVSISNADAQFLESRKFDVEEIARAYRVPKHLVQSTEGTTSWGTGIEGLNRGFFDYSLADRVERWEQELNLSLLTTDEIKQGFCFCFDLHDLLSGSAAERAKFYRDMRDIAAMSVNEVRRREKLTDLPDNIGDDYRLTFNGSGGTAKALAGGAEQPADQNKEGA